MRNPRSSDLSDRLGFQFHTQKNLLGFKDVFPPRQSGKPPDGNLLTKSHGLTPTQIGTNQSITKCGSLFMACLKIPLAYQHRVEGYRWEPPGCGNSVRFFPASPHPLATTPCHSLPLFGQQKIQQLLAFLGQIGANNTSMFFLNTHEMGFGRIETFTALPQMAWVDSLLRSLSLQAEMKGHNC